MTAEVPVTTEVAGSSSYIRAGGQLDDRIVRLAPICGILYSIADRDTSRGDTGIGQSAPASQKRRSERTAFLGPCI